MTGHLFPFSQMGVPPKTQDRRKKIEDNPSSVLRRPIAMTPFIAKLVWWAGIVGWYVIRIPHERRSRKTPIAMRNEPVRDMVLLAISFTGLFVIPVTYVVTGVPRLADYAFEPALAWLGTAVFALSLALFY